MIEGGMSPVHRLSTSPPSFPLSESHEEAQARPLFTFLSPSSSQDQRVDAGNGNGYGGGPSLAKPEAYMAVRVCGSSSDSNFLSVGDGDGWCGDNYGMGWMSSKMRLIQKMKTNNYPNHLTGPTTNDSKTIGNVTRSDDHVAVIMNGDGGGNHVTRVCSDCSTTTTPLWRSGPRGPKSLCNACGIRQRKARRAMEEAAVTAGGFDPSSSSVTSRINGSKVHNKEKKSRGVGHSVLGPTCKKTTKTGGGGGGGGGDGLLGDFSAWRGAFPRDVTEAAILLMDLSCGFAHS